MCTVTLLPIAQGNIDFGVRIGCNRDESTLRPPAIAPTTRAFGKRTAILPIDPESNGTWIAVNDAGLAMIVLNRNLASLSPCKPAAKRSRGTIIPELLQCGSIGEAIDAIESLCMTDFNPFRLLVVSRTSFVEIDSTRPVLSYSPSPLDQPIIFASSSLGDNVVEAPRTELFRRMFPRCTSSNDTALQQDRFHKHQWPNHKHLSVRMARKDALTVSFTAIQIFAEASSMIYREFDRRATIDSERSPFIHTKRLRANIWRSES